MVIPRKQSGFALLIFMMVVLGAFFLALSGILTTSVNQQLLTKKAKNIQNMKEAKEALLSYSVAYMLSGKDAGDMGKLPCPDLPGGSSNNGVSDGSCEIKGVNSIGYFPYKTVGLGKVTDSSKECFWYVVSANYKNVNAVTEYGLRNWDSNGFIKIVDEAGNLQHGSNKEDYPIALLISPGKNLNQDRSPDLVNLSDCRANYSEDEYLEFFEGGFLKKYSVTLDYTADTEWTFLQPSPGQEINNAEYNDQIIAIYKNEFWDRVKATGDLTTTNMTAAIEDLTESLNLCLANYMTNVSNIYNSNAVYPADLNIADYTDKDLYLNTDSSKRYGRFPENISTSKATDEAALGSTFLLGPPPTEFVSSYCSSPPLPPLTPAQVSLWKNWKDHFFMVVADDFMPGNATPMASKCSVSGSCLDIGGKTAAAIVFFSQEATVNQDRTLSGVISDQYIWDQYLDGVNQTLYQGALANNIYDATELNDYAYCVTYDVSSNSISAEKC